MFPASRKKKRKRRENRKKNFQCSLYRVLNEKTRDDYRCFCVCSATLALSIVVISFVDPIKANSMTTRRSHTGRVRREKKKRRKFFLFSFFYLVLRANLIGPLRANRIIDTVMIDVVQGARKYSLIDISFPK